MKKMLRIVTYPEMAGFFLGCGSTKSGLRGRKSLIMGLALLVVLLSILVWVGLTHKFHPGSQIGLTTTATTSILQVTPPRNSGSLAYDPVHKEVLLFGGNVLAPEGGQTNETWAWNGQTWRQLHPTTSPPALLGSMVYDAASQQIILFLNQVQSGGKVDNEMWAWNGSTWHQLQPLLLPEVLDASMAYDAAHGQIVLFGGAVPHGGTGAFSDTTWLWNGTTWQEQHPAASPSPRTGAAMAYDETRQQIVLYGGITQDGLSSEVWTWDGTTWQQHQVTNQPSARQGALLVYDGVTRQTLLFGGINALGTQPALDDTWAWDGKEWARVSALGAPTDFYESAAYDDATRTVVVYAVLGSVDKLETPNTAAPVMSQTWIGNGTTWKLLP